MQYLTDNIRTSVGPGGALRLLMLLAILALGLLSPSITRAQTPPDSTPPTTAESSVVVVQPEDSATLRNFPSPGGAFLRSVLIPGWGQAVYGSYFRGGVYFAAEAGSWFMLLKTLAKLGEAREIESWRVGAVRDSLMATIAADEELAERLSREPGGIEGAVAREIDEHPNVVAIRKLVDARKEQREDWIVLTLFWMLASGVDAYVTAHLSDFPAKVTAEPRADGSYDFGLSIPVGGRR